MTSEELSLKPYIIKLLQKSDLTADEVDAVFSVLVSGSADPAQAAALLTLLAVKGESVEEIYGFARALRSHAVRIAPRLSEPAMDPVGTGGDGLNTFNISTTSMFVIAAAGIPVAKHGNVGITSKSGSADLLRELGIKIDLPAEKTAESIEKIGVGFMFAPLYHPSMKHIAPVRRNLPFRTVFNILGPLCNPAFAGRQVFGVFHRDLQEPIASVLSKLGVERALVVTGTVNQGAGYMDEISPFGITYCIEVQKDKGLRHFEFDARDLGIAKCTLDDIRGGVPAENAQIALRVLGGKDRTAVRDVVCLNAGAGLYVAGRAKDMASGFTQAVELIESGAALGVLERWRKFCESAM
ncbi:MAG: anthranilate phosphoribosyltransferase [Candidatus Auribacterota bacterium]